MRFTQFVLAIGMAAGLSINLLHESQADSLHLYSGKMIHGKLSRVTGDLIEFKEAKLFGNKKIIQRLHLSNRHDCVETRNKMSYFGEIIYVDKFKIDMQTATGMVKINRLMVNNVIMGTPMEQPAPSSLNRIPIESAAPTHMNQNPNSNQPPLTPEIDDPAASSFKNSPPYLAPKMDDAVNSSTSIMSPNGVEPTDEDEDVIPAIE